MAYVISFFSLKKFTYIYDYVCGCVLTSTGTTKALDLLKMGLHMAETCLV